MTNTIKTTYKQTSTDVLIEQLKRDNDLFAMGHVSIISDIDKVQCELVSRGFTWDQVETM